MWFIYLCLGSFSCELLPPQVAQHKEMRKTMAVFSDLF